MTLATYNGETLRLHQPTGMRRSVPMPLIVAAEAVGDGYSQIFTPPPVPSDTIEYILNLQLVPASSEGITAFSVDYYVSFDGEVTWSKLYSAQDLPLGEIVRIHVPCGGVHRLDVAVYTAEVFNRTIDSTANEGLVRSNGTVALKTTVAHGYKVGQLVNVNNPDDGTFGGTGFEVLTVPSTTIITYAQPGDDAISGGGDVTNRIPSTVLGLIP